MLLSMYKNTPFRKRNFDANNMMGSCNQFSYKPLHNVYTDIEIMFLTLSILVIQMSIFLLLQLFCYPSLFKSQKCIQNERII